MSQVWPDINNTYNIDNETFFLKMVINLAFFLIINTVALNLIFGIIIDTFADLRSETASSGNKF